MRMQLTVKFVTFLKHTSLLITIFSLLFSHVITKHLKLLSNSKYNTDITNTNNLDNNENELEYQTHINFNNSEVDVLNSNNRVNSILINMNKRSLQTPATSINTISSISDIENNHVSLNSNQEEFRHSRSLTVIIEDSIIISRTIGNTIYLVAYDINDLSTELDSVSAALIQNYSTASNTKYYVPSQVVYFGNNEFMMFYESGSLKSYLYSKFVKYDPSTKTFATSSYSPYSDQILVPNSILDILAALISSGNFYMVDMTYNCKDTGVIVITQLEYV